MYRMRVLAVLIGLVLVAGISTVQGQNATINQGGNENEATIVQVADDLTLTATIDQAGNENEGMVLQTGGSGNTASLSQAANDSRAMIMQDEGVGNSATGTQVGPGYDNEMFILQDGGTGNTATATQTGSDNSAKIMQDEGTNNSATLTQTGNSNGEAVEMSSVSLPAEAAGMSQATYLSGVCFGEWSIYQRGYDLVATTDVTGNGNNTFQYQEGEGHSATIDIDGNDNCAFQAQCGFEPTTSVITIAGNGNFAGELTWGGVVSNIDVTGNGNCAMIVSGICD
jgi:hypothetical protein